MSVITSRFPDLSRKYPEGPKLCAKVVTSNFERTIIKVVCLEPLTPGWIALASPLGQKTPSSSSAGHQEQDQKR